MNEHAEADVGIFFLLFGVVAVMFALFVAIQCVLAWWERRPPKGGGR